MKVIVLGEKQIENLNAFLDKVPVKGRAESIAMVELVQAIQRATEYEEPEKNK